METKRSKQQLLLLWATLLSQGLLISAMSDFEDQKNFFYPDPNTNTPPIVSYTPPPSGGGHATPTPSHGGGAPPANCGTPTSGGHHSSNPVPPVPVITPPSPPQSSDPNSPPFTCTYWKNHPTQIWALFGWWGNVGNAFGVTSVPGFESSMNLLQALSNTRTDGYGEICREGTAALLNAMTHSIFPYTTAQVKDKFAAAMSSNTAAADQARLFKLANQGKIKFRV